MIEVKNLSKTFTTFSGTVTALNNVSLSIPEGCCTVIGGENGSGKSVLVSILAGLETQDAGEIIFDLEKTEASSVSNNNADNQKLVPSTNNYSENQEASSSKKTRFNNRLPKKDGPQNPVGLVFQEAETQILGETPREDIAFGPKNQGRSKEEIQAAVENALNKTSLSQKADFPARFLSGGEKRRLAVACMLAMEKPVIILDEPYANLDFTGVKQVNALISELKKDGKTVVILTHEIEKCLALTDRFIVLFRGNKVFDDSPQKALEQPEKLENWNIRNPFQSYDSLKDLLW